MEEKSFSQMKKEFMYFYHNEVKNKLPAYEKARRVGLLKLFVFWMMVLPLFSIVIIGPMMGKFMILLFIIPLFLMLVLRYLTRNDPKEPDGRVILKVDLEMDLKRPLMTKFVNIFLTGGQWQKCFQEPQNKVLTASESMKMFAKTKEIREQKILNPFPGITYDDIISGMYKNVPINIYEANSSVFTPGALCFIPLFLILATVITFGLIWIVLIFLAIVFSWKIFQYAPFRGTIVEIKMNKNFKGHTFFHQKTLAARKIPIDTKKYSAVELEKSGFSDKYKVYSDNQVEARYLLTTAMMERIENLSFSFKAKSISGSFKDDKLILAINTGKDMFAMGSDFKASNTDTFAQLYDEMVSVLQIVDELKLNQHTGL